MSKLDFRYKSLTESKLTRHLEKLGDNKQYEKLDLSNNKLTGLPDLRKYKQFDNLKVLILSYNKISEIDSSHIPPSVSVLSLSGNLITSLPNLSHCTLLTKLRLLYNKISEIDGSHIPPSVSVLSLSNNVITSLPNLSHCTSLKILWLDNNKISEINGSHIPPSVSELWLGNNLITSVPNLSHCTLLTRLWLDNNKISEIDGSHIPPSVSELWLGNNLITSVPNLSHCTLLTVLWLSNNKISEIEGSHIPPSVSVLRLKDNHITSAPNLSHCTHLRELWLDGNSNFTTLLGLPDRKMDIYFGSNIKVLGKQCFHRKTHKKLLTMSRECSWQLIHPPVEVLKQGLEAVIEYFKDNHVSSTQTSLILLGATAAGKSSMMKSLIAGKPVLVHIDNRTQVAEIKTWEITALDSIQMFDHGGHDIYAITTPLLITKNGLIALVHDITKRSDSSLEETINIMLHALQYHPGNQIILVLTHTDECKNEEEKQRNCKHIQAKIHQTLDEEILTLSLNTTTNEDKSSLTSLLKKQKENMQVFLLSSKTCDGMDHLRHFLEKIIAEKRIDLPAKWVKLYKLVDVQKKKFLKVSEMQHDFKQLYSRPMQLLQRESRVKNFASALAYYREAGHLLHFPDNPVLKEIVFHDKLFVLDVFKSCFHHSLEDSIDFSDMLKTLPDSCVKLMVQQYQQEGLLSVQLRKHLWSCYGLEQYEETALLEIMKKFHLCYPIGDSSDLLFFPWFVKSNQPPASMNLNKLSSISKKHFSVELECVFANRIPVNAFEAMQVQIQKTAVDRQYCGSRQVWHNGILVKIGTLEVVALRKKDAAIISICISGHATDINEVWQVATDVNLDLDTILQPLLGIMKEIYFKCNHCLLKSLPQVQKWSPQEVLKNKGPVVSFMTCQEEEIPRALVIATCKNHPNNARHTQDVQSYLGSTCMEMSPPGKLVYLDCEEIGENQFRLSWCLPSNEGDIGPIPQITHAVVESRQGRMWTRVADNISDEAQYTVECIADEFRVAAVNQNGCGEFACVTPVWVVQGDDMISESDRQKLKDNHEFFTRMTNMRDIIIRLLSRRVISGEQKECLIRKPDADELMEKVIYRVDYKKLYLFQKTLRETGQLVMAEFLPVKVASLECMGSEPASDTEEENPVNLQETAIRGDLRVLAYQRGAHQE